MAVEVWDFEIIKGASVKERWWVTDNVGGPIDLTGCTVEGQVRETYESAEAILDLPYTVGSDTLEGVETWYIELNLPADDTVDFEIPASDTVPPQRPAVHDAFLTWSTGQRDPLWRGECPITESVTRP